MHDLLKEMATRISAGIKRKSITTCSAWTEQYRILGGKDFPGPWTFRHHPWLKGMHDSNARFNIGQKAAQMGFTETVLNRTFFKIDIERVNCMYVLPSTTPDASDFSASRFDPALELSPHLNNLFNAVKNVGHKRAADVNLYIRGSKSRSGLKSVPVGFLVMDEVAEFEQDNIPLALERQAGQMEKEAWMISTPTSVGFGISGYFAKSTQEHFFFKCPHCSLFTELIFPDCVVITADSLNDPRVKDTHYICKECKHILLHETKADWLSTGIWVPSNTTWDDRGFYVNQLYSPTIKPYEIAQSFLKGITNLADEQEFHNSKMGEAHTPEGSRINDNHIVACMGDHLNDSEVPRQIVTMGVDVGKWIHYVIEEWFIPEYMVSDLNIESKCKVIKIGKCLNFEDLDKLMYQYHINYCVIDANPERRKAFEFSRRFLGFVKLCVYGMGVNGKQINVQDDTVEPTITVDRTSWLDLAMGRVRAGTIRLPRDTPEEYKEHLKAIVRVIIKDRNGNPVGRYEKKENDSDHYAHARNYSEIALTFAAGAGENQDVVNSPI